MNKKLLVLNLEDCQQDSELIGERLAAEGVDCRLVRVEKEKDFIQALEGNEFDLILADYSLPAFDGISALKIAREKRPEVPLIFISGAIGEELAIEMLKNGASDYILKNHMARLAPAVRKALQMARERAERKQAEEKLRKYRKHLEQLVEERTAELKASLIEKEILLKEIYHRTKNNMQVISGLLNLQSMSFEDDGLQQAFRETQDRIRAMALVHERLYKSKDLSNLDIKEYIEDLCSAIMESYPQQKAKISVKLEVESISMPIEIAAPCGLIINELLSNSLKHAFPMDRTGEIRIAVGQKKGDEITLTYSDNGVGFPDGLDISKARTLGLRLVHNLVSVQLKGRLDVFRNGGARFEITFSPHFNPSHIF